MSPPFQLQNPSCESDCFEKSRRAAVYSGAVGGFHLASRRCQSVGDYLTFLHSFQMFSLNPHEKHRRYVLFPAWFGSVVFHLVILALIIWLMQFRPIPTGAPEMRFAEGGIILKTESDSGMSYTDSENNEYDESSSLQKSADSASQITENSHNLEESFSDVDLNQELQNSWGLKRPNQPGKTLPGGTQMASQLEQGGSMTHRGVSKGGKAKVRLFGADGEGSSFVFVFDRSKSMTGKPIQVAKAELLRSLESLDDFHKFNIIFYNEEAYSWKQGIMPFAKEIEKTNAAKFIGGVIPNGGTAHEKALTAALRLRPDVIFFLTDGEDGDDLNPSQLRELERLNHRIGAGAQINVIQFGIGANRQSNFLRNLAAQNQGQFIYLNVLEF
ncbi:MAG: vWA domain-containing protein [Thermoguttaceae bacterium]